MKELDIRRLSDGTGRVFDFAVDGDDLKAREVATWGFETVADLSALDGDSGAEKQIRISDGFVQVRENGEANWVNACAVSALDSLTPVEAVEPAGAPFGFDYYWLGFIMLVPEDDALVYTTSTNFPLEVSGAWHLTGHFQFDFGGEFENGTDPVITHGLLSLTYGDADIDTAGIIGFSTIALNLPAFVLMVSFPLYTTFNL
jgi:hypothetical protein